MSTRAEPSADTGCLRCGTCCRKGPPGLHRRDAALYQEGVLGRRDLITLRCGEWVFDNVRGARFVLEEEMIRIRPGPGGVCPFLQGRSQCRIYESRPAECRALQCWNTTGLERMYCRDRLGRHDLLGPGSALRAIVDEHERSCPYPRVRELAAAVLQGRGGAPLRELTEMTETDERFRSYLRERAGADRLSLQFLLGRALAETLPALGVGVEKSPQGVRLLPRPGWAKGDGD